MSNRDSERIRMEMSQVRRELDEDVGAVVEQARELTDWRNFVKRHPWLTVSAAAAIGFFVVPKRLNLVTPSPDVLEELAARNRLVVKPKADVRRQASVVSPLINLVAGAMMRSAMTMAGQKVTAMVDSSTRSQSPSGVAQS